MAANFAANSEVLAGESTIDVSTIYRYQEL